MTFKITSVSKMSFMVVAKHRQVVASGEPRVQPRKSGVAELRVQEPFLPRCAASALGCVVRPHAKYSSR